MSHNDVPGHGTAKGEDLAMGCWAEHSDGSLIFIEGVEKGRVIFSVFDFSNPQGVVEYRDMMNETDFEKKFSLGNDDNLQWTWHDKTPFPWARVIDTTKPGVRHATADDQLSAAARVAESRKLRVRGGRLVRPEDYEHRVPRKSRPIWEKIQNAISRLGPGDTP
jgi:hypothetical protein